MEMSVSLLHLQVSSLETMLFSVCVRSPPGWIGGFPLVGVSEIPCFWMFGLRSWLKRSPVCVMLTYRHLLTFSLPPC